VAALGGRRDIMDLATNGTVSIAGTYSGNAIAVAASIASLDYLTTEAPYHALYENSDRLRVGLNNLMQEKGVSGSVVGLARSSKCGSQTHRSATTATRPARLRRAVPHLV